MRIGIIGTGWGVRSQVPGFRAAGLDVVGLAGRDAAKTAAIAKELHLQPFSSWQELLHADIDLVSITTPPPFHREMAIAALEAGKHVLCEKPAALEASEVLAMLKAAEQRPGQMSLIDHELRFLPAWVEARAVIQRGDLGPLRYAVCTVSGSRQADTTRPWNWMSDAAQGGGLWANMGSHQIDTLRFLWGEIEAVSVMVHTFVRERPYAGGLRAVSADDFLTAHLHFVGGGIGSMTLSMVAAREEPNSVTIHGTAGALRLQDGRLKVSTRGEEWIDRTPPATTQMPEHPPDSDFGRGTVYLGHALHDYGTGNRAAISGGATFLDGLRNQQVLDAGRRSHAEHGVLVMVEH